MKEYNEAVNEMELNNRKAFSNFMERDIDKLQPYDNKAYLNLISKVLNLIKK